MSERKLRSDEEFVISHLVDYFGPGDSWCPGEDPPDCYLKIGEDIVAVEVSTVSQHVVDDFGKPIPRLSQDMALVFHFTKKLTFSSQ
jgi:hypothetical protein